MRTFSATAVTIAGLVLAVIEFAIGGTELPGLLGEDAYAVVAFVLGVVGVVCTFILRDQVLTAQRREPEHEPEPDDEAGDETS